jgi:serine/threonine-protein kinase
LADSSSRSDGGDDTGSRDESERPTAPLAKSVDPARPAPPPDTLKNGALVDDYRILRLISSGGFGSVYAAVDERDQHPVALKVLHAQHLLSQAVPRFEREVRILQSLRHRNIVHVHHLGVMGDGRPYFVMEMLVGEDLGVRLRRGGRMSLEQALAVLAPLCDALAAVHDLGIVHRDLKATNVFIAREQSGAERVVLLDFGVAKLLDAESDLTRSRQTVGTPAYMAPEHALFGQATRRSDIYSLGVLAFRMLAGRMPFGKGGPDDLGASHRQAKPARLSEFLGIARHVDDAVARATSPRPEDRFDDARAFLAALSAVAVSPGPAAGDGERRLRIQVQLSAEGLDDPDDALLAELDRVGALLTNALVERGFQLDAAAGPSLEFSGPSLTAGPGGRADQVRALLAAHGDVVNRRERDGRVGVKFMLDLGESGPSPGDDLEVPTDAVLGSAEIFADVELSEPELRRTGSLFVVTCPPSR